MNSPAPLVSEAGNPLAVWEGEGGAVPPETAPAGETGGDSGLNRNGLADKPVYPVLAAHQRQEQGWDYHSLASTLDEWYVVLNGEFRLDLPRCPLRLDRLTRRSCLGHFRAEHNEFGLECEIAVRVPPAGELAALDLGDTLGTLLHEMLHLEHFRRTGRMPADNYHHKAYRKRAGEFGLVVNQKGHQNYQPEGRFVHLLRVRGVTPPKAVLRMLAVAAGASSPPELGSAGRESKAKLKKWSCGCTNGWFAVKQVNARCIACGNPFRRCDGR